jgi:hypothetical protein
MAGTGPAPAEVRRRRNQPARGEWVDLPPLERPVLPELPPRQVRDEESGKLVTVPWSNRTEAAWAVWSTDPVTQMYSPADIVAALELALLFEGMTVSNANEVRLRMDGLGLTPKGKKDLRWRVMDTGAAAPAPPARRGSGKKASNRRARLSVVK